MNISNAIQLVRETCALRHFSIKTEKTYVYWLGRYGGFLKDQPDQRLLATTSEQKMEAFLTRLAREGMAASTQNQAFKAVLFFYREILKQEIAEVNPLRAKQQARHCPTPEEVRQLLGAVTDIYG